MPQFKWTILRGDWSAVLDSWLSHQRHPSWRNKNLSLLLNHFLYCSNIRSYCWRNYHIIIRWIQYQKSTAVTASDGCVRLFVSFADSLLRSVLHDRNPFLAPPLLWWLHPPSSHRHHDQLSGWVPEIKRKLLGQHLLQLGWISSSSRALRFHLIRDRRQDIKMGHGYLDVLHHLHRRPPHIRHQS